jgi:putative protease
MNDRVFKVFDAKLMQRARDFFTGGAAVRRVPVNIEVTVAEGQPLKIKMEDNEGFSSEAATNFIAEKALKRPLTEETISKQMDRLGTTIFAIDQLKCSIQGEVMVPVSEMNDARRRAAEGLEEARLTRFERFPLNSVSVRELLPQKSAVTAKTPKLLVNVDSIPKVEAALQAGADAILFGGETFQHRAISDDEYRQAAEMTHSKGKKVIFNTPRLVKEWQTTGIRKSLALFQEIKPDGVGIANLGTLFLARELTDLSLYGDYSLNVYNSVAAHFFDQHGLSGVTLSPELTMEQVAEIAGHSQLELTCLVHGYLTLMVSEYCVLGSFLGDLHTGKCKGVCTHGNYWLKDR